MARKDIFKGTLEALINPAEPPARPQSKSILQSTALGAVETSFARGLQLTDLPPSAISDSEYQDRLPYGDLEISDLVESMRVHGQQIPILVQRTGPETYKVIYGRRRIAAARHLGMPVRALITQMDDEQRIITQGIENTVRQDLSFIEKAIFAHRLREAGVSDATIRAALNIDVDAPKATTISTMKMIVENLGEDLILAIGRAPGIGRPRWRGLAEAFRDQASRFSETERSELITSISAEPTFADANQVDNNPEEKSDDRFKRAMALIRGPIGSAASNPSAAKGIQSIRKGKEVIATVRQTGRGLMITVLCKDSPGFHDWVQKNASTLVEALHDRWQAEEGETLQKEEAR